MVSERSRETINALKCLLAIGVVLLHARFFVDANEVDLGWGFNTLMQLDYTVLQLCVPIFFCISGYLFFNNAPENPSFNFYKKKWKARVNTLLIPYLIGNIVVLILFFISDYYLTSLLSGNRKLIYDYKWWELLLSFWKQYGNDGPINEVLWFIRDLMVMVMLTPAFYYLLKRMKWVLLLGLAVWYLLDHTTSVPGLRPVAFFFFSLGSYVAINKKDLVLSLSNYGILFSFAYLALLPFAWFSENLFWIKLTVIVGLPMSFYLTDLFIKKHSIEIPVVWVTATFFLYIFHDQLLITIRKFCVFMMHPQSLWSNLFIFFFSIFVTATILLCVFFMIRKYLPRLASVIVGGRI